MSKKKRKEKLSDFLTSEQKLKVPTNWVPRSLTKLAGVVYR